METNPAQTGMVFYNYNVVDSTITATSAPVQIEFGSADVARQINQQVQLQYSNLHGLHPGQTQQIVITSQPTFDTTDNIDPILIKSQKSKIRSNGERVPCLTCGKTFSCNANLRDHMRLHTGERPFQCTECGMTFAQRSNWRLHKRVHTGERPYMCGICGKTFSRSSHLPGHIRVHTGERPFQCECCDHTFSSAQALKNHTRTHTGEKPFACETCSTSFTHSSSLSSHKKRCTGEKRKRGRPIGSMLKKKKRIVSRSRGRPKKRGRFGRKTIKIEDSAEPESNIKEEVDNVNISDTELQLENAHFGVVEEGEGSDNENNIKCPNAQILHIPVESLVDPLSDQANIDDSILCDVKCDPSLLLEVAEESKPVIKEDVVKAAVEAAGVTDSSDLRQEAAVTMTTLQHSIINATPSDNEQTF